MPSMLTDNGVDNTDAASDLTRVYAQQSVDRSVTTLHDYVVLWIKEREVSEVLLEGMRPSQRCAAMEAQGIDLFEDQWAAGCFEDGKWHVSGTDPVLKAQIMNRPRPR